MCGDSDIHFHIGETKYVMTAATVPAFDAELFCNRQQVVDTPIAWIVAHGIEYFGSLVHGNIVSYLILRINTVPSYTPCSLPFVVKFS